MGWCFRTAELLHEPVDRGLGLLHRLRELFAAELVALHRRLMHIGDADVAEHRAHRVLGVVQVRDATARVVAVIAARTEQHHALAGVGEHRPVRHRAARAVEAEGAAHPDDVVDVRLELRGHAEVVHGQAHHDQVGGYELVDEAVALGEHVGHPGFAVGRCGKGGVDPAAVDIGGRVLADIEVVDAVVWPRRAPALDKACGEAPRVRTMRVGAREARAGAGVDVKQVERHVVPSVNG